MKIEVNVEKRYFFVILAVALLMAGIIGVYAVWDVTKTMFHSANDVKVTINGTDYSLQEAITSGKIGGIDHSDCFWTGDTDGVPLDGWLDSNLEIINCSVGYALVGLQEIEGGDNRIARINIYCCRLN